MSKRFWKVIVRYGHVGRGKEVSVARYICTQGNENITDASRIVENMPGVKVRGVGCIFEVSRDSYLNGKAAEPNNLYLQKLMSHRKNRNGNNANLAA